jgi:glutamate-1-semialdehyde 2,1-aminomutase
MFGFSFLNKNNINNHELLNFSDIKACDSKRFNEFFHFMLNNGVYFAPSSFEAGFISASHSEKDIDIILNKVENFYAR